MPEEIRFSTEF